MGLLLEAVEAEGPWRWRWLLSDEETGNPIADHMVRLDPESVEVTRFTDLYDYVDFYATPGRRAKDGARFVAAAGAWAGRELLGDAIGSAIAAESPVTVRVKVPASLDSVLLWPLELAHADGSPLAARGDVTLVYDIAPDAPPLRKAETGESLRVLAVFSQPTRSSLLALRRERYALGQLIRRLRRGRAMVTLQVVQYGATRERLAEIAEDGDGWDVLHLSGHGAGGAFLLEKADGSPDLVPTDDLVALLHPVRRRIKLTVLSACESAANATAETYRLLGLTGQAEQLEAATTAASATGQPAAQVGLARALVQALGCAVVGMRNAVPGRRRFRDRLRRRAVRAATVTPTAGRYGGGAGGGRGRRANVVDHAAGRIAGHSGSIRISGDRTQSGRSARTANDRPGRPANGLLPRRAG
jgi:hypothetical protein